MMIEGILRLCAHLKQTRCMSNRLIGHLKDMLLNNADRTTILIDIIQSCSSISSVTDELRELAEIEAKAIYTKIFSNITLEELHILASMGTARIMKNMKKNRQKEIEMKNNNNNNESNNSNNNSSSGNDNDNDNNDIVISEQAGGIES